MTSTASKATRAQTLSPAQDIPSSNRSSIEPFVELRDDEDDYMHDFDDASVVDSLNGVSHGAEFEIDEDDNLDTVFSSDEDEDIS